MTLLRLKELWVLFIGSCSCSSKCTLFWTFWLLLSFTSWKWAPGRSIYAWRKLFTRKRLISLKRHGWSLIHWPLILWTMMTYQNSYLSWRRLWGWQKTSSIWGGRRGNWSGNGLGYCSWETGMVRFTSQKSFGAFSQSFVAWVVNLCYKTSLWRRFSAKPSSNILTYAT